MDQKQRDLMEEVKAIIAEGGDNNQPTEPIEQPAIESNKAETKEATPDTKTEDNKTQENNETKSDKEVASLQEQLLNGKSIADLEETAAGGSAGGASNDGVSLGAASFVQSGHYSNINANFENLSSQANTSADAFTNVSGGEGEEGFTLETLEAAIDNAYEVKAVSSVDEAGNVADLSTPTTFYFPVPTAPEDHL